jgi:hypothetical protein
MERGGQVAWNNDILATTEKDSIEREQANKFFHSIVPQSRNKARKLKTFDLHVDEDGNISFPRARSSAWNRIRELEMFGDAEIAWYGLFPYEKCDEPLRVRVHDAWKHDALNALTRWETKHREAVSDRVIKQDENASRKRAREDELALRDDFPGPHDSRNLSQEQKEWAEARNAAEGWTLESGECPQQTSLPPRKRRRVGLRFDDQTYVRSDYALDSGLFRPRQTGSDAGPSSNPPPPAGDHMYPPPTRPYYTVPTKKYSNRKKGVKRHERRITIEDNRIDTSGAWRLNKDWDKWDAYIAALEAEDERSETHKEIETELLRLYDLVARLRRSGQKTESTEVLIRAYERLAWALEAVNKDSEEQLRREMANEERRRGEQPAPRGGMAIAVAWVERARGTAREYLRRLAENTRL